MNTYKSLHWAVKGKLTESLRQMAVNEGLPLHKIEDVSEVERKLNYIKDLNITNTQKSKMTKNLTKEGVSKDKIKTILSDEFPEILPPALKVPPLFTSFSIRVKVFPPTRRRLDPVNLYPTVKALIDGLTDVHWWEDDDHNHLKEISFKYGGLSSEKGSFQIELEITETKG